MKLNELKQKFVLFTDLDGVLSDFSRGVKDLTGKNFGEMILKDFWRMAYRAQTLKPDLFPDGFYTDLHFMPGGEEYWNAIRKYDPIVLTGIPYGNWAPPQKVEWVHRHLNTDRIITCLARDKAQKAMEYLGRTDLKNCILIDDNLSNIRSWIAAGGIGIIYYNAAQAVVELEKEITAI
jgi:hypothetical protein